MTSRLAPIAVLLLAWTAAGCGDSSADGEGGAGEGGAGEGGAGEGGAAPSCEDTDLEEQDLGPGADPEGGDFTLEEALDGLPEGDGPLVAVIDTSLGSVRCELFPDIAPNAVANFVGLARGRQPFLDPDTDTWILGRRYYDGLTFHRVIDDFVAQGGDPLGSGFGGPGYEFADEIADETHSPGTLAYANSGANTNGSQFYIVAEVAADFLDGGYTIFGRCEPVSVVQAITEVEAANERPVEPITMTVSITRCAE